MNNKGFTTIELLLSFTLTVLVLTFLFDILLGLKGLYIKTSEKTNLLVKQAVLTTKINEDLTGKVIISTADCGSDCIAFYYTDGSSKELSLDRDNKSITYGDYKTSLPKGTYFGNIEVYSETYSTVLDNQDNAILQIKIPILNKAYKGIDFGVNALYQYDSRKTNLSQFDF